MVNHDKQVFITGHRYHGHRLVDNSFLNSVCGEHTVVIGTRIDRTPPTSDGQTLRRLALGQFVVPVFEVLVFV